MNTLAGFITKRRLELGMTQAELARRSGVPVTTVNRVEAGVTKLPGADVRRQLARALHVEHAALLVAAGEITESELGEGTGAVEPAPVDIDRSALISRVERIRLTPERIGSLERVLDLYLSFDDASHRADETAGTGDGLGVTR